MNWSPNILFNHGYNIRDKGKGTIDRLKVHLKSIWPDCTIDCDSTDYGWHGLLKVRFFNKKAVRKIADKLPEFDIVVNHSNGANYLHKALELLKKEGKENENLHIIHFSPALNRKQKLEDFKFKRMDLFCSKSDWVVRLAKYLPFHDWGNAGQKGIKTEDPRYNEHYYHSVGHSDWFYEPTVSEVVEKLKIIRLETDESTNSDICASS